MKIKPSDINLPRSYWRASEFTFPLTMGNWITVASFISSTAGHRAVYAKHDHNGHSVVEITSDEYAEAVAAHIGKFARLLPAAASPIKI